MKIIANGGWGRKGYFISLEASWKVFHADILKRFEDIQVSNLEIYMEYSTAYDKAQHTTA